jgi:type II secretory pathway component PulF
MPTFHYSVRGANGETSAGSLEAHSAIDAMNQLRRRGLRVERLRKEDDPPAVPESTAESTSPHENHSLDSAESSNSADVRLGIEELAEIAGRISSITKSQLPLLPGLRALTEGLPSRSLRRGLRALCLRLERGEPLDTALQGGDVALPRYLSGLIEVGVQSRRLGEVMDWFLNHVRRQTELRRRCRASLIYPVLLLTAGMAALSFGLVLIVPAVRQVYTDMTMELPGLTVALLTASDFMRHYGLGLLAAFVSIVAGVPILVLVFGGRALLDRSIAATPFLGTMYRCTAFAGFCELLAIFVATHLPLPQAIRLAGDGCGDADLREQFDVIAHCLELGQDDVDLFARLAQLSPHLIHVFHWKNREANFTEALQAAVRIYENQARLQVTLAGMLLEPIVIVGVLGFLATFMVALFMPLIQLLKSFT